MGKPAKGNACGPAADSIPWPSPGKERALWPNRSSSNIPGAEGGGWCPPVGPVGGERNDSMMVGRVNYPG